MLIFPTTSEDKYRLLNSNKILAHLKKEDVGVETNKHAIIIKGITKDVLEDYPSELKALKIVRIDEFKNKEGTKMKMCKLFLENNEAKKAILYKGKIALGLFQYKCEANARQAIRCHRCKELGHFLINCKNKERCSKCSSEDHVAENCTSDISECVNCGDNHSSYYKGCLKYKELLKAEVIKITTSKEDKKNTRPAAKMNEGFTRTYSSAVQSGADQYKSTNESQNTIEEILRRVDTNMKINQSVIEKKFDAEAKLLEANMKEVKSSINNINVNVENISKSIVVNNGKLCYFILDFIKILLPQLSKPTKKAAEQVNNVMQYHKLGSLNTDQFYDYIEKIWGNKNQFMLWLIVNKIYKTL